MSTYLIKVSKLLQLLTCVTHIKTVNEIESYFYFTLLVSMNCLYNKQFGVAMRLKFENFVNFFNTDIM